MHTLFLLLLVLFSFGLAILKGEERLTLPLEEIDGGAKTYVAGCVNVISGSFVESSVAMELQGPESISFEYLYSSADFDTDLLSNGWRHNRAAELVSYRTENACTFDYSDEEGRGGSFKQEGGTKKGKDGKFLNYIYRNPSKKGFTNLGSGIICGRQHFKNNRLEELKKSHDAKVICGDGTEKLFKYKEGLQRRIYTHTKDIKTNGLEIQYDHTAEGKLKKVTALNPKSNRVFSWISIKNPAEEEYKKEEVQSSLKGSDGSLVIVMLEKFKKKSTNVPGDNFRITKIRSSSGPTVKFEYVERKHKRSAISKKSYPENRFLNITYFDSNDKYEKHQVGEFRVKELMAPVGIDATPIVTHRFKYFEEDPKSQKHFQGHTKVHDAYNHRTDYFYDFNRRLIRIETFKEDGSIHSKEHFIWGQEGQLLNHYLEDADAKVHAAKCLKYDEAGNVIRESFFGNLTGNSLPIKLSPDKTKAVHNGCDVFETQFKYSDDEKNLLIEEVKPTGQVVKYRYHPTKDLLIQKLIVHQGNIVARTFYSYDEDALETCRIEDDGKEESVEDLSGVTQRKIIRTTPRQEIPFGYPQQVEEYYVDLNLKQEVLLSLKQFEFSPQGQLTLVKTFDAERQLQKEETKQYDAHGNVILECNPLGQTIERKYDANDNLIYEQGFRKDAHVEMVYDFSDRLIAQKEFHSDGVVLTTSYAYDYLSRLTAKTNPQGQKTLYTYDAQGNVKTVTLPSCYSRLGQSFTPQTSYEHDLFGNEILTIDSKGHTLKKTFNIRGQPTKIIYPDGSQETFSYTLDGNLKEMVVKSGLRTCTTYDLFGRAIQVEQKAPSGEVLSVSTASYSTFNKLAETAPEGLTTYYSYDFAGRLKSTKKEDALLEYAYDASGRLASLKEWTSHDDYSMKCYTYDLLNRITEEVVTDAKGIKYHHLKYTYDEEGKQSSICQVSDQGNATCFKYYNSRGELIKEVDTLGNTSYSETNFYYPCSHGLTRALTITHPDGTKTLTVFNSLDKVASITKKNALDQVLSEKDLYYDTLGNLTETIDKVIFNGSPLREILTEYHYNSLSLLTKLIEASGTEEQKVTLINYNSCGQKIAEIKADGREISSEYDAKGRLAKYSTSDGKICYSYAYDRNDRLLVSKDEINGKKTCLNYDRLGRVTEESLGNGYTIRYAYDHVGRHTKVSLHDGSSIEFAYNAVGLKEIARRSPSNQYSQTYSYDDSGKIHTLVQPGKTGTCTFTHDKKGQITQINSPHYNEDIAYDVSGSVVDCQINNKGTQIRSTFTYDALQQLTSEKGVASHSYAHDSLYNCLEKDKQSQEVNSLNQLIKSFDRSLTYDLNGNRTKQQAQGAKDTDSAYFEYDTLDRLVSYRKNGKTHEYTYDSFNRRLSKATHNASGKLESSVDYLYFGQNEVGSLDAKGNFIEFRVLGVGRGAEIGATVAIEIGNQVYAPLHDHRGSIVSLVDIKTGVVAEKYLYSAFGEEVIYSYYGYKITQSALKNPWRFSSKRLDEESGLINFGRRFYDPATARWISPDPLGFEAGPNLYAYVYNNPISRIDLYGLEAASIGGASTSRFSAFKNSALSTISSGFSTVRSFGSGLKQAAISSFRGVGKLITGIGREIPIPGIKDAVTYIGHAMEGRRNDWNWSWSEKHSSIIHVGDKMAEGKVYVYTNGMCNEYEEYKKFLEGESEKLGGCQVIGIYNASHGTLTDLGESFLNMLGIETNAVKVAKKGFAEALANAGPDGTVYALSHSQGALINNCVYNSMSREQLARIESYTWGAAKVINNNRLRFTYNCISAGDGPSNLLNPVHCIAGLFGYGDRMGIDYVMPKGSFWPIDHAFDGYTYRTSRRNIIDDIKP